MLTVLIALGAFVLYLVAYRTYGRYLARRIFRLEPDRTPPSVEFEDGVDYVPSRRAMVFGHHFTSIAGTGPIVGPAVAVVWGWVPALVWVLVGSIVMGAVHDFGSLVVSMRNRGRTIADLAGDVVTPRVRVLFLIVVVMGLWIVLAIFGLVIATIFKLYPSSVWPVWLQIPIAVGLGLWLRRGGSLLVGSLAAVGLMYATIVVSSQYAWAQPTLPAAITDVLSPVGFWTLLLLGYVFVASVLPVQVLLQPRDFINSWQLLIAMGLLLFGLLVSRPPIVADAVNFRPAPATEGGFVPPFVPFLFVTIACGAISGFHCLVASGCSSRQLRSEADAQYVGYGAMLTEGFLAVLVILACVAGIGLGTVLPVPDSAVGWPVQGRQAWAWHYATWGGDNGLGDKLAPFITGSANMIESLGVAHSLAVAIMGVFVASFAATTLDSACRLQRYVIAELAGAGVGGTMTLTSEEVCAACGYPTVEATHPGRDTPGPAPGVRPCPECGETTHRLAVQEPTHPVSRLLGNRYVATGLAVSTAAVLALSDAFTGSGGGGGGGGGGFAGAGKGALILWPIFGATNQLLAGLALLVVTVWLVRNRRPAWVTALPMVFMLGMTGWAIVSLVGQFAAAEGKAHLLVIGVAMLILEVWIVAEAVMLVVRRGAKSPDPTSRRTA
ncbi:MAG: carbon starvation CstA family protein [Planctomycetota bacterium]|nr:carbon starvation CstA family protein [Planctomycetota bacterium]